MRNASPLLLGAALLTSLAASAASFVRAPYVQNVQPDSAIVAFQLDGNCNTAQVHFGPEGRDPEVAVSLDQGRQHGVILSDLPAGRRVSYRVEACGAEAGPFTFRTATGPEHRYVHFGAFGDMGTGGRDQKNVSAAIEKAAPELVLSVGDNAYDDGTEQEWTQNYFAPMAPMLAKTPVYLTFGNHDYLTDQGQPQINAGYMPSNNPRNTERYYSFDWGHVHFVALDSQCYSGWTTTPECSKAEQRAWLEADLAANKQPWTVVFMHHPPYSTGEHGGNARVHDLMPLFEAHGVDMVLGGHDHLYERIHPLREGRRTDPAQGGIPYWVIGSAGARLRSFVSGQPAITAHRDNVNYGFLNVVVDGGTLTADFVNTEGRVIDSYTATKVLPEAPFLNIGLDPTASDSPLSATLISESNLQNARVIWDLGDGTVLEGARVTHTYAEAGTYRVRATAEGADGRRATNELSLQVSASGTEPDPDDGDSGEDPGDNGQPPPGNGGQNGPRPGAGGEGELEPDGCQSAPALLLPLALLGLIPLLRRRRQAG